MKIFKSKTINLNILAGAIVIILKSFGIDIDEGVITAIFVVMNFVLRLITKEPISAK